MHLLIVFYSHSITFFYIEVTFQKYIGDRD
jgi:hypothetical protein